MADGRPAGYNYDALRKIYFGTVLAFVPGMHVPDSTVAEHDLVIGDDVTLATGSDTTPDVYPVYQHGAPTDGQFPVGTFVVDVDTMNLYEVG